MTLRPRKTSHRNRVGWTKIHTGWGSRPLRERLPTKRRIIGIVAVIFLGLLITGSIFSHSLIPSVQADFNTSFSHTRGSIWVDGGINPARYNFNSTCLSFNFPNLLFSYTSGVAGTGGKNCNSADIVISKTPVNMQSVSAKMLEMDGLWIPDAAATDTVFRNAYVFLRTNGTLPGFNENYNPENDPAVRLIWKSYNSSIAHAGNHDVYVMHDNTKSLSQETIASDSLFQAPPFATNSAAGLIQFQMVLNYTGSNSLLNAIQTGYSIESSTSNSAISQFANGQNFFVGYMVQFFTSVTPCAGCFYDFKVGANNGGGLPNGFGIWTVPSSCQDPVNKVACSTPTVTPVFNFNPLDPSTWGNAIIQGFSWVFLTAIPVGFNLAVKVLETIVQIALNTVGNFFGWGNIGDAFINAVNGIVNTIVQVVSAISNFLSGLVARGLDLITIATTFSSVFFTGASRFFSEMSTISSGIVTIFSKLFLYGGAFYFLYDLILYFQLTGDAGFEGVGTWIGFNKWAAFSFFGVMTRILNALVNAFDWILSHIPTIGAKMPEGGFPGIPQLAAGDFPGLRIPTGHVTKLREGDPAAFFLWAVGGFLILPFYLGSAISPLAGLTAAVGCNPTTCFNNMLTTVGYPFAGLFIIIFVGVTITEILHGITDVGGQRIVIQNKLPAGFGRFKKEAKGEFTFGTGKFAQFKKGRAKQSKSKAVERQETISREQAYENRHGSSVFE